MKHTQRPKEFQTYIIFRKNGICCCHCQTVVVSNNSANVAYIAPFDPNKALTAAAGFPIPANTVLQVPFAAGELAVVASAASTDVRFLLLD